MATVAARLHWDIYWSINILFTKKQMFSVLYISK